MIWGKETAVKFIGGKMIFRVSSDKSASEMTKDLDGLIRRSHNMRPAMEAIGLELLNIFAENFRAQGRPRWVPLDQSTIQDRVRQGFGPGPTLFRTGTLMRSVTQKGAPFNIFQARNRSLRVGSRLPYFLVHDLGGSNVPQRQMSTLPRNERRGLIEIIERYVKTGKA